MIGPPKDRRPSRGLSMERKLPLLITTLLVAVLATGLLFAYAEVRNAAMEGGRQRLSLLSRWMSDLITPSLQARAQQLNTGAADPSLVAFLQQPTEANQAAALARLAQVSTGQTRLVVLRDAEQRPLLRYLDPGDSTLHAVSSPDSIGALPEGAGYGPLFAHGGNGYYWLAAPIRVEESTVGYLTEMRFVGAPDLANALRTLLGPDVSILFANAQPDAPWVGLDGSVRPAPESWPFLEHGTSTDTAGNPRLAHADALGSWSWRVIVEQPQAAMLSRPRVFLRRSLLGALALCMLGALSAWMLSRGITRPVRELHEASEAIAHGNYDSRIDLNRRDELGALAASFNWMADQVQSSHDALREQYETAAGLAEQLEATNQQLEVAVEEAERAREEAEMANRAKSDFLATMSHEIRTPINAIIGYTDLLHLGLAGPVTPEQQAHLERIRVSGRHLSGLVDQVLDLARVEAGAFQPEHRLASAREAMETAMTVLQPQASSKGVEVSMYCPADADGRYLGDPQAVEQILVNLLANAIKFTEPGGRSRLSCETLSGAIDGSDEEGRWVCIRVEDTGVGIEPDQRERIFEPFVQVDSGYTRRHGGAGLGLAISLRLARSMGGTLTVSSQPGAGSSFTLWLPAEK